MGNWLGVVVVAAVLVNAVCDLAWNGLMKWAFKTASVRDFEVFSQALPPPSPWARDLFRWKQNANPGKTGCSHCQRNRIRPDP
ncbi:hypothetical protein LY41_002106 [Prauserella halophila]|nr:hypothetical protein [Prauserella halophila]